MKLFTLGDSLSQGFRSLAAARTDQCYSALVARALGAAPYSFPEWPKGGMPADLERILRHLEERYGSNIRFVEWLTFAQSLAQPLDESEDYYERGQGAADRQYGAGRTFFHNVEFWGANVADAWQVTPALCKRRIAEDRDSSDDDLFGTPSQPFYRTALKVLNPNLDPALDGISQVGWLERHARGEGIENVMIWLGANNALGTVIKLEINQTNNDPTNRPHTMAFDARDAQKWNLWHPADFAAEYRAFMDQLEAAMSSNRAPNWRVFVGNVPYVTIAPLAKGVGATSVVGGDVYYKYYTYFPFEEDFARTGPFSLTMHEALHIDRCIRAYNATIKTMVDEANDKFPPLPGAAPGQKRFVLIDLAQKLRDIAWKRNAGDPPYQFPAYFDFIYPKVDTKYYHADAEGRLRQGGLFSLDGVHPTAIGHGLIAWEVLKAMKAAGVDVNPDALDWPTIFASDSLYSQPIRLMGEIYEQAPLAEHVVKLLRLFWD
jgi:hypothetical protein